MAESASDAPGGRPVSYDRAEYRGRNVIERGIAVIKQGELSPPATTNTP